MIGNASWIEIVWTALAVGCLLAIVVARGVRQSWHLRVVAYTVNPGHLPLGTTIAEEDLPILGQMAKLIANGNFRRQIERAALLLLFILLGVIGILRPPAPGEGASIIGTVLTLGAEAGIVANALIDEWHLTRTHRLSDRLRPRQMQSPETPLEAK